LSSQPFEHHVDHLMAEMAWIRALVGAYLESSGRSPEQQSDKKGLMGRFAVTPDEAASLLQNPPQEPRPPGEAALIRKLIDARVEATQETSVHLPLKDLVDSFDLDELSYSLLILALGAEIDESIRRLYMFTWNDFTRRWPTVEFLLSLLQPSSAGRILNAGGFAQRSALVRWNLIHVGESSSRPEAPFFARPVRLAPSVAAWCTGGSEIDPILSSFVTIIKADDSPSELVFSREVRQPIDKSLAQIGSPMAPTVVLIGSEGTGKSSLAREHLCTDGRLALEVHAQELVRPPEFVEMRLAALQRDASILQAALIIDLADADQADPNLASGYRLLAKVASTHKFGAVVTARDQASWFVSHLDQAVINSVPLPLKGARTEIWRRVFSHAGFDNLKDEIIEAGARNPLSGGSIKRAAASVINVARMRGATRKEPMFVTDVTEACRAQLSPKLQGIAHRIVTSFTWQDLILPDESRERLEEIVSYSKHSHRVFQNWGYARLLPYGRGLSVLFSGPPGTGKTMAAGIIAGELGMDIFRVDLSRTVSKYIGETEKNLGRVFDEASKSQSILLFDEADSLFAKRTAVKSSVDRYANLEVNYLLQRVEDFDGVTILTTNFEGSIDEAFRRRIRFRVNFPAPTEETRALLWKAMIPDAVPTDETIDFTLLGAEYDLTGGHIKNAAVRAAFFAAAEDRGLKMDDFYRACRLEAVKLGKVVRSMQE
jgi:AAA+ superfamily predicted ATPase